MHRWDEGKNGERDDTDGGSDDVEAEDGDVDEAENEVSELGSEWSMRDDAETSELGSELDRELSSKRAEDTTGTAASHGGPAIV